MQDLLTVQGMLKLKRPIAMLVFVLSFSVALIAWLLVRRTLSSEAVVAQWALTTLLIGALPGLLQVFALGAALAETLREKQRQGTARDVP